MVRFGDIKRGQYFRYRGQRWKRTHGHFATPVQQDGSCGFEGCFDVNARVEPVESRAILDEVFTTDGCDAGYACDRDDIDLTMKEPLEPKW